MNVDELEKWHKQQAEGRLMSEALDNMTEKQHKELMAMPAGVTRIRAHRTPEGVAVLDSIELVR